MSGEGCNVIQNHPSSKWFGIPVAYYGMAGYLGILACSALSLFGIGGKSPLRVGFGMSMIGALTSIALQIYGAMAIRATCDWCLASAALMCALAVVNALAVQHDGSTVAAHPPSSKLDFGIVAILVLGSVISLGLATVGNGGSKGTTLDDTKLGAEDPYKTLTTGAPAQGPTDAPVTIVEFADLYCGSCKVSFEHMKKLMAKYPGKIRWVFRHFPLFNKEGHELALPTAVVAEYCDKQGKFWEFVDQVFSMSEDSLKSMEDVYHVVKNVNADTSGVTMAIENQDSPELTRVTADINLAHKIGINETPTFILLTPGARPVALRFRDLDPKLNTAEVQKLLGAK